MRAAIALGVFVSAVIAVVIAWTGAQRWTAAAIFFVLALSAVFGAEAGVRVGRWADGHASAHLYMYHLSSHPVLAAIAAIAGLGLMVAWWAGLGVDGSVRWLSEKAVLSLGHLAQRLQTGRLQEYLFATVVGIVAIIFLVAIV
ncbi:hypothetical protein HY251_18910 [bacterium]|nr:hypothetical protein [bacterium]